MTDRLRLPESSRRPGRAKLWRQERENECQRHQRAEFSFCPHELIRAVPVSLEERRRNGFVTGSYTSKAIIYVAWTAARAIRPRSQHKRLNPAASSREILD